MNTVAAIPDVARKRFSVAEYQRMGERGVFGEDERLELIEGAILEMSPIGSAHGGCVKRLTYFLTQAVGARAIVSVQDPLMLSESSAPQPDIALLRPRIDFYARSHPEAADALLVIEVADTSLNLDLRVKAPLYARHAIAELWIVDLGARGISRFTKPEDGVYQVQRPIDFSHPTPLPSLAGCAIDLSSLF